MIKTQVERLWNEIASVCNINLFLLIFSTPTTWNLNQTKTTFDGVKTKRKNWKHREKVKEKETKRLKSINFNVRLFILQPKIHILRFFHFRLVRVARRSSVSSTPSSFNPTTIFLHQKFSVQRSTSYLITQILPAAKKTNKLLCAKRHKHEGFATSWVEIWQLAVRIEFIHGGNLRDTKNWW